MTGLGTTHDKENNVSVTDKRKEKEELLHLLKQVNNFQADSNELTSAGREISPFNICRRVGPPLFKNFSEPGKDLIEKTL